IEKSAATRDVSLLGPGTGKCLDHHAVSEPEEPADEPVRLEEVHQTQTQLRALFGAVAPGVRGQEVFPFEVEPCQPFTLIRAGELRPGALRKGEKEPAMERAYDGCVTGFRETLLRVLPHRFQQPVAAAIRIENHQRLLDELSEEIEPAAAIQIVPASHGLDGL